MNASEQIEVTLARLHDDAHAEGLGAAYLRHQAAVERMVRARFEPEPEGVNPRWLAWRRAEPDVPAKNHNFMAWISKQVNAFEKIYGRSTAHRMQDEFDRFLGIGADPEPEPEEIDEEEPPERDLTVEVNEKGIKVYGDTREIRDELKAYAEGGINRWRWHRRDHYWWAQGTITDAEATAQDIAQRFGGQVKIAGVFVPRERKPREQKPSTSAPKPAAVQIPEAPKIRQRRTSEVVPEGVIPGDVDYDNLPDHVYRWHTTSKPGDLVLSYQANPSSERISLGYTSTMMGQRSFSLYWNARSSDAFNRLSKAMQHPEVYMDRALEQGLIGYEGRAIGFYKGRDGAVRPADITMPSLTFRKTIGSPVKDYGKPSKGIGGSVVRFLADLWGLPEPGIVTAPGGDITAPGQVYRPPTTPAEGRIEEDRIKPAGNDLRIEGTGAKIYVQNSRQKDLPWVIITSDREVIYRPESDRYGHEQKTIPAPDMTSGNLIKYGKALLAKYLPDEVMQSIGRVLYRKTSRQPWTDITGNVSTPVKTKKIATVEPGPIQSPAKIIERAEALEQKADERISGGVFDQNWTRRRAGIMASMSQDAENMRLAARFLRLIAAGESKMLARVGSKAAFDLLRSRLLLSYRGNQGPLVAYGYDLDDLRKGQGWKKQTPIVRSWMASNSSMPTITPEVAAQMENRDYAGLYRLGVTPANWREFRAEFERVLLKANQSAPAGTREQTIKRLEDKIREGGKIEGFYATPPAAIDEIFNRVQVDKGDRALEPSAGAGDLAEALRDRGATVDVIEPSMRLRDVLKARGFEPIASDFLLHSPDAQPKYDLVVMNPPFEKGAGVEHTTHAIRFLKPGGVLASILPSSVTSRTDKRHTQFRELVDEYGGEFIPLPEGSFKASRFGATGVHTVLLILEKP